MELRPRVSIIIMSDRSARFLSTTSTRMFLSAKTRKERRVVVGVERENRMNPDRKDQQLVDSTNSSVQGWLGISTSWLLQVRKDNKPKI